MVNQAPNVQHVPDRKSRRTPRQTAARSAARDVVIASRASGMSLAECAKAAGVSENTALRYIKSLSASTDDMSREAIISMLSSRLASKSTQDQYVAPLVAILSKLKGWTDREARVETVRPIGELFTSWASEIAAANVGAPTCSAQLTPVSAPVLHDGTHASVTSDQKPGEPPNGGDVGSVKFSPPPPQKF